MCYQDLHQLCDPNDFTKKSTAVRGEQLWSSDLTRVDPSIERVLPNISVPPIKTNAATDDLRPPVPSFQPNSASSN